MLYPAVVESSESRVTSHRPGQVLRDGFMTPLKIDIATLALMTGLPTPCLREIISGQWVIGSRVAARLGDALGTGPAFWLELQSNYSQDRCVQRILRDGVSQFLFGSPWPQNI